MKPVMRLQLASAAAGPGGPGGEAVLLAPVLAFVIGASAPSNDAAFLARIHRAVAQMSDRKTAFVRFDREVRPADARRCRLLQSSVRPNSQAYADLAFVQAYWGVDYEANLQRLLRPYRLWTHDIQRWEREYPPRSGPDSSLTKLYGVFHALNYLYLKHHDLKSLGLWLDLRLDGDWSEESDDELGELWQRHAADMLRAAAHSPRRLENLADALEYSRMNSVDSAQDRRLRREFFRSLAPLTRSPDPPVARTASRLRTLLRKRRTERKV